MKFNSGARATTVNPGVACDTTWNTGLIESPDGNPNSYMHCVSMGFGLVAAVFFFFLHKNCKI